MKFPRGNAVLLLTLCIVELWAVTLATLSKSDKGKKKKKDVNTVLSVHDRNLVNQELRKKHVIEECDKFSPLEQNVKNFKGPVLGYVTPWNNHGYDVAKMFGAKFSHISPVWLQAKRKAGGAYVIEGGHDIDKGWMKDVRKSGSVNIVPRILFDGWNSADYLALFKDEDSMEDFNSVLVGFIKEKNFQGAVIEIWSQLGGNLKEQLIHFLTHLADDLHDAKKSLILVIPPGIRADGSDGMFVAEDFKSLVDAVDYFSLMTYDYSSGGQPGPNSPIEWVEKCVEAISPTNNPNHRGKILLGLNFYGTHYTIPPTRVDPILGRDLVDTLKKQQAKITWDPVSEEHIFDYKTAIGRHLIYYPTPYSIHRRLELANRLGTGVSIWEIGQGMDFFYDLF
ncbi:chitinase domain-containing protein 1-like [Littorina saxatilis]|uniref:Chitinase domain-containing protein 1 n=1 Tax=Littorina saxatilis TaxID=31220 RepID=A0AAN9ARC4_9CAEN